MVAGVVAMAFALVVSSVSAQAVQTGTRTFSNETQIKVPANRIAGQTGGQASPYPSSIRVTGFKRVTDVNVILKSVGHTDPDDMDILLQGPTGRKAILWSDAGGTTDILDVRVKLDDEASQFLPNEGQVFPGNYMTSNYIGQVGDNDIWPGVTQNGNRLLSTFDGTDPAGGWRLFVNDDLAQPDDGNRTGTGTINSGWALQVKGVCTRATADNRCR